MEVIVCACVCVVRVHVCNAKWFLCCKKKIVTNACLLSILCAFRRCTADIYMFLLSYYIRIQLVQAIRWHFPNVTCQRATVRLSFEQIFKSNWNQLNTVQVMRQSYVLRDTLSVTNLQSKSRCNITGYGYSVSSNQVLNLTLELSE